MQDSKAIAAPRVIGGQQALQAQQDLLASTALRERMDLWAQQVRQAVRDYVDLLANRGLKALPVQPDPRVRMALLALRDQPAHLAPPARKVLPGPRV